VVLPDCDLGSQGTGLYEGSYYTFSYSQGTPVASGAGSLATPVYFPTYVGKFYNNGSACYNAIDAQRTDIVNDGIYGRKPYTLVSPATSPYTVTTTGTSTSTAIVADTSKEASVSFSFRPTLLFLAAAYVSFVLAANQLGHSQSASAGVEKRHSPKPFAPNLSSYGDFIEVLGDEDEHIQSDIQHHKAQILQRRDYATALDISKGEEQTMLAIFIEAFHKGEYGWADQRASCDEYLRQYGRDEGAKKCDEHSATLPDRKYAAMQEAVVKLKEQLGAEILVKLTEFLESDKFKGSYVWGVKEDIDGRPDPCPPNNNPPPGQTTHLACADTYNGDIFWQVGWIDDHNKGVAEGKWGTGVDLMEFNRFDRLPKERKEAALAISLEADHAINEAFEQYATKRKEFTDQIAAKYGYTVANQIPPPTEVEVLWRKRATILEEYILRLKQEVGDDFFNKLDAELSKKNKTAYPLPANAPGSQRTPAVHP